MTFSYREILHLYARAGFGLNRLRADELLRSSDPIAQLFPSSKPEPFVPQVAPLEHFVELRRGFKNAPSKAQKQLLKKEYRTERRKAAKEVQRHWFEQLATGKFDLVEKMALFWHGHFACRIQSPHEAIQYTEILRTHGLGNFKTLLIKVSQSAAMIDYLHLRQNKRAKPNEDFARELCELFTLGRGVVYTEYDVKEIARAFTGWNTNEYLEFATVERWHDTGMKTIFGQRGHFTGEDVIDLLLSRRETAEFIAGKLYSFFVHPQPHEKHISEIAQILYSSGYDIKEAMNYIFNASWFYSKSVVGAKIKSPLELLVGLRKQFHLDPKQKRTWFVLQRSLAQVLYNPPNVAGWPSDTKWIDASRLAFRLRLPSLLLNGGEIQATIREDYDANPMEEVQKGLTIKHMGSKTPWERIAREHYSDENCSLPELLLRKLPPPHVQNYLNSMKASAMKSSEMAFQNELLALLSLPDYQLT